MYGVGESKTSNTAATSAISIIAESNQIITIDVSVYGGRVLIIYSTHWKCFMIVVLGSTAATAWPNRYRDIEGRDLPESGSVWKPNGRT